MIPELCQSTLSNGIRVISQATPGLQGAAIAIHVASGSRNEDPAIGGAAHFIEHLLFKGTEKQTTKQIISEFDAMGIDPNACTSQEGVSYYFTALREYLPKGFELLCDMFLNSTFPEKELETERMVILEEITRNNDNHDRYLSERFFSGFWAGHPIGRPVIGTHETVTNVTREQLINYKTQQYHPSRTIVAAAGNVNHKELVGLCEEQLGGFVATSPAVPTITSAPDSIGMSCVRHNLREMQQVQLYLGYPALLATDKRHWGFRILNNVLGCGMGSRLFMEVREVRGLAYSVGSGILGFSDTASLIVYAGCDVAHAQETIDICHQEVMKLVKEKLTPEFLADAKRQARGRHMLGLDDPSSQALGIANELAESGIVRSFSEDLDAIEAVTPAMIQEVAEELFCGTLPRLESVGPEVVLTLPS